MKRIATGILAAVLMLSACSRIPDILYRTFLFGSMDGQTVMYGDDGRIYHFNNTDGVENIPSSGRVVAYLDAISLQEGTDNDYEASLLELYLPLSKDPVLCSNDEEEIALGKDPINISNGIVSAGHLNLVCSFYLSDESDPEKHVVNLQVVPLSSPDSLRLVLRHNATDDLTLTDEHELSERGFYASFPLDKSIPEDKSDNLILEIRWFWDGAWESNCVKYERKKQE